jgi:hypothetical protein
MATGRSPSDESLTFDKEKPRQSQRNKIDVVQHHLPERLSGLQQSSLNTLLYFVSLV